MTRNEKGFTLIEAMIAMGIMSVIMMGLMQLTVQMMITSQTADTKAALTSIVQSTMGQAFNQATCTAAVTKTPQNYGTSIQFDTLKDGAALATYGLMVKTLTYESPTLAATGYDGTKVYYGTLTLSATASRDVLGGKAFAPRPILAFYLTVNPAGVVTGCSPSMPTLPSAPPPPPDPAPSAPKTLAFDADPKVCENFPAKATCASTSQKIVVTESSYGQNCGVAQNYGLATVQALCNGQASCSFTAGNINNCTGQGVFIDPAVGCAKGYHMTYYCK